MRGRAHGAGNRAGVYDGEPTEGGQTDVQSSLKERLHVTGYRAVGEPYGVYASTWCPVFLTMTPAVVGGTDGLGRAIAALSASRGAKVIVVGRTFRDNGVPNIQFMKADLSKTSEAARVASGRE